MKEFPVFVALLLCAFACQNGGRAASDLSDILSPSVFVENAITTAIRNKIFEAGSSVAVQDQQQCLADLVAIAMASRSGELWAAKYMDSQAVKPSGFLSGNFHWYGDFDECLSIKPVVVNESTISPQFCRLGLSSKANVTAPMSTIFTLEPQSLELTIGVCVPKSCTTEDFPDIFNPLIHLLTNSSLGIAPVLSHCLLDDPPFNAATYVTIVLFSLIGACLLVGLGVDLTFQIWAWFLAQRRVGYVNIGDGAMDRLIEEGGDNSKSKSYKSVEEKKEEPPKKEEPKNPPKKTPPSFWLEMAQIFSPYTNFSKIISLKQPDSKAFEVPNLNGLNAIRTLSLLWVMLGHIFAFTGAQVDNLVMNDEIRSRLSAMFVPAGFFAVDTFLFLSGFLSYWALAPKFDSAKKFWKWLPYIYLNRYIRLTPPFAALILIVVGLWPQFSSGPFYLQIPDETCVANWWTNLLYVNNLVNSSNMCIAWSWYLSIDMQLFVFVPFVVYLFVHKPNWAWIVCGAGFAIEAIIAFALTYQYNLPSSPLPPVNLTAYSAKNYSAYPSIVYIPFYTRMGPYIVGIMCCHVIVKESLFLTKTVFSRLWLQGLLWLTMFGLMLALTYGPYESTLGTVINSAFTDAMYNAFARPIWGLCVAWLVTASVFNSAGPIDHIFSWPGWAIPARLSYAAYLVHPLVLVFYMQTSRRPLHSTDLNNMFLYFDIVVGSLIVAVPFSLAFESPVVGLQRMFLKK